ncbi:Elongin-A [Tolypocladium ophioglossoides CBS 100239]|uniref:Elongin-A n=1 Tax=Tolypocladium ophioglossoides (strain CBS 100239) TaxID=1163406 RepID=A0A0L0N825_TOLOC|nr:Elongin-A [Tolypocladium ophioglossoides CBS 100239]
MPPVKSLLEIATMVCIKNIKGLESVGDYLPYESVRHILLKVDSAYQMRQIELNSPQLQGETGEIWIKIIENDFPLEYKATAYKPQSPDKWYRVWEKYKKEHDLAIEESENKLKNALAGLQEVKEKNTSKIVERKYLPRAGRTGPKRAWGQRDTTSSALTFKAGSRTKTNTGASVMRKVRREVKEIAAIHGQLSRPIRGPTRQTEVKKAPSAMVNDYRRAANPQYRTTNKAPESLSAVEQYEKRATFISDSEEDDDAPFGEVAKKLTTKPAAKKPATAPIKNPVAEAAKVSLLKKKPTIQPTVLRPASSTKPATKAQSTSTPATPKQTANTTTATNITTPQKQDKPGAVTKPTTTAATTTTTTTTTTGKGAATLANKFRRSPTKPQATSNPPADSATTKPSAADSRLPATRTTPTREGSAGPSSSEELIATLAEAAPVPTLRKRKAIDIFMRPKKRVH